MTSNQKLIIDSFIAYLNQHPNERWFQALRNWLKVDFINIEINGIEQDTFYIEDETLLNPPSTKKLSEFKEFKKFLAEKCYGEKEYGDGKYDKMIFDYFTQKTGGFVNCLNKHTKVEVLDALDKETKP